MKTVDHFFPKDYQNPLINSISEKTEFVWEILDMIQAFLDQKLENTQRILGEVKPGAYLSDMPVLIEKGAVIHPKAVIEGPALIQKGVNVRPGAYIRANSILMEGSVVGNSSEIKNSILLPNSHAPHFNYVGDSILGSKVNLGAGTKLSNLTVVSEKDKKTGKRPTIKIMIENQVYDTGLAKMGAILGDNVQTGCNSVLNPGTLVGPNTLIYPNLSLKKGYYYPNKVIKLRQDIEIVDRT